MTTHSRCLAIFRTRNAAPPRASFPKRIANSAVTVVLVSVPVRLAPSRRMILHSQMQTSASVAPPVSRAVLQLPARLRTRPCSRLSRRFSKIASFVASQNGICDAIVSATDDLHWQPWAADGGARALRLPSWPVYAWSQQHLIHEKSTLLPSVKTHLATLPSRMQLNHQSLVAGS